MIQRATWFFAAGSVLVALMLAAVAYGWWHIRQDAARDKVLRDAIAATAAAQQGRDEAIRRSLISDSLARVEQARVEMADTRAAVLQHRLDSLSHHQSSGDFSHVPSGQEPDGITWREAYFVADSALIQERAAKNSAIRQSKLFQDDRDHWKLVSSDQAKAIDTLNKAVATALKKNDCHLLFVIACPSRTAMVVGGIVAGVIGTVLVKQKLENRSSGAVRADSLLPPAARRMRVTAVSLPIP